MFCNKISSLIFLVFFFPSLLYGASQTVIPPIPLPLKILQKRFPDTRIPQVIPQEAFHFPGTPNLFSPTNYLERVGKLEIDLKDKTKKDEDYFNKAIELTDIYVTQKKIIHAQAFYRYTLLQAQNAKCGNNVMIEAQLLLRKTGIQLALGIPDNYPEHYRQTFLLFSQAKSTLRSAESKETAQNLLLVTEYFWELSDPIKDNRRKRKLLERIEQSIPVTPALSRIRTSSILILAHMDFYENEDGPNPSRALARCKSVLEQEPILHRSGHMRSFISHLQLTLFNTLLTVAAKERESLKRSRGPENLPPSNKKPRTKG